MQVAHKSPAGTARSIKKKNHSFQLDISIPLVPIKWESGWLPWQPVDHVNQSSMTYPIDAIRDTVEVNGQGRISRTENRNKLT